MDRYLLILQIRMSAFTQLTNWWVCNPLILVFVYCRRLFFILYNFCDLFEWYICLSYLCHLLRPNPYLALVIKFIWTKIWALCLNMVIPFGSQRGWKEVYSNDQPNLRIEVFMMILFFFSLFSSSSLSLCNLDVTWFDIFLFAKNFSNF